MKNKPKLTNRQRNGEWVNTHLKQYRDKYKKNEKHMKK